MELRLYAPDSFAVIVQRKWASKAIARTETEAPHYEHPPPSEDKRSHLVHTLHLRLHSPAPIIAGRRTQLRRMRPRAHIVVPRPVRGREPFKDLRELVWGDDMRGELRGRHAVGVCMPTRALPHIHPR